MSQVHQRLFGLDGRVALVTGGAGALGLDMAKALQQAGAAIVLLDRDQDRLDQAVAQLTDGDATTIASDVTDPGAMREAVERARRWKGRLDILLNAAGTHVIRPSHELTLEEWQRVISVNLTGTFVASQAVAPVMKEQGGGKIINIGSVMSTYGMPRRAAYAASKGGVAMLTRSLAQEWGPWGICVNAISPGFFRTRLNEHLFQDPAWVSRLESRVALGRAGRPGDLWGAVIFLASPASDYVNGHVLYVDGGFTAGEPW